MPRVTYFIVCNRSIVDVLDNQISLVALLETINVPLPPGAAVPERSYTPITWSAVARWERLPEDADKTFEQRTQLIEPGGQEVLHQVSTFDMTQRGQRIIVNGTGFPVAQPGLYVFRISLRQAESDQPWQPVAEYPIQVIHLTPKIETQTAGNGDNTTRQDI